MGTLLLPRNGIGVEYVGDAYGLAPDPRNPGSWYLDTSTPAS